MAYKINYTGSSKVIRRLCESVNDLIDHGSGGSSSAADVEYDNSVSELSSTNVQDAIDEIAEDFQDGCDTISQAVIAKGQTPASNSPEDIAEAIGKISGDGPYVRPSLIFYAKDGEIHIGAKVL